MAYLTYRQAREHVSTGMQRAVTNGDVVKIPYDATRVLMDYIDELRVKLSKMQELQERLEDAEAALARLEHEGT